MLQLIILLYIFNSLIWLRGLAEVVSTRQPKLITRDNNDLYHFLHLSGCWDAKGARFISAAIVMPY